MLATLSTYTARAKRKKQLLCLIGVEQFESALAAVRAAATNHAPLGLYIQSPTLVRAVLSIAYADSAPVIVLARCTTPQEVQAALALGVGGVSIPCTAATYAENLTFISSVVSIAAAHNANCILEWSLLDSIPEELLRTGAQGIILTVPEGVDEKRVKQHCTEALKLHIPLFLEIDTTAPRAVRQFRLAGFAGYFVRNDIEEAYTAGLRAALRNRSVVSARQYAPYGIKAVEQTTHNLIQNYSK